MYWITASATYSSQTVRNNALNALTPVVAGITAVAGRYPAGLNTSGNTVLTVSLQVETAAQADALREAMRAARSPYAVTSGHFSVVRVD